jgi:hypothetical protein
MELLSHFMSPTFFLLPFSHSYFCVFTYGTATLSSPKLDPNALQTMLFVLNFACGPEFHF